jgi:hypothetical protein
MSPQRKTIEVFGKKGRRNYVRVVRELTGGVMRIRVLWKEPLRQVESFEDTRNGLREARAFAEGVHDRLTAPLTPAVIAPRSLREIFQAYLTAKVDEWADNTLRLRRWRWSKFELYAGRDTLARDVTRETLDGFKRAMLATHAPNQVRQAIKEVTGVFRWAVDRDMIPPTKVTNYSTGFKKAILRTGPKMAEYSRDERDRIIAALDPRDRGQWRAWALNVLFSYCGPRQSAARHLEVADIELEEPSFLYQLAPTQSQAVFGGRIHWREETNKTGEDWWQPMPHPVAEAFWVALGWRQFDEYTGRFIFYGVQRRTRGQALRRDSRRAKDKESLQGVAIAEKPYTYAAFNSQLHAAEQRAGVEWIKYGAAHRHRRGVAGDVHEATGSEKAAADWLGDKSTKVIRAHYLLGREEDLQKTAALVMDGRNAPESESAKRNEMLPETSEAPDTMPGASDAHLNREPAVGIEPTTARSQKRR